MAKPTLASLRQIIVPVIDGCPGEAVLNVARSLTVDALLVGIVCLSADESLSASSPRARRVRERLRALADADECFHTRARVLVSHTPWADLKEVIDAEAPDLLLLEWSEHLAALNLTPADALLHPPCDIALVRGPVLNAPGRVLLPLRGGPHAELALRLGLNLRPRELTALHIQLAGDSDAPFRGLERVLARLPEVQKRSAVTDDAAKTILDEAGGFDLTIVGATARPAYSPVSLGPVADRVLLESPTAVMVVKTRRPMPESPTDEIVGAQAISILVDKWFAENTFDADEFADIRRLIALKREQGLTISLALPALNEADTVGHVIRTVKRALMDKAPLLDEIVLVDSDSTDRTREIAVRLGVPVHIHQRLLPELGVRLGKGEALWKSLFVTSGDIIAWIDTDIVNIHPRFVYGVIGPLLLNPRIQFVKGFYRRPLRVGDKMQAGGGGRVTELTARPLLNLFYPELSGVIQPLSGEYAGRRAALEQCAFFSGYGVETGLLIDIFEKFGLSAIAQVDLLERIH
ncbi:MAG TPA: glucosyl-3-phosphoglycerate synthase, partial [Anaerolineales bacterium]|nr:glucosyl-3-phosphoglycerate synthase [Anaerolineales bacterium]